MATRRVLSAAWLAAAVLAAGACAGCIGPRHLFGSYQGTVVDAETGEPIEGAVVVVFWWRCWIYEMDGCGIPHSIREAVTGPAGEFAISACRDLDWHPLSFVGHHWAEITVYAVDYLPLSTVVRSVPGFEGDAVAFEAAMMRGRIIPLRRPESPRQLMRYASPGYFGGPELTGAQVPNLCRAINRQNNKFSAGSIGACEGY